MSLFQKAPGIAIGLILLERKGTTEKMEQQIDLLSEEEALLKSITTPNRLGKEYAQSVLNQTLVGPLSTQCILETNINLIKTMLLLKHYKQIHKEYPSSLEQLDKNTLFPLPLDYFSFGTSPFKYNPKTLIISSVKGGIRYDKKELYIELEPPQNIQNPAKYPQESIPDYQDKTYPPLDASLSSLQIRA